MVQRAFPTASGRFRPGWTMLEPRVSRNPPPLLMTSAKRTWPSGWAQIYWQQNGHKSPIHFICPPEWTLGRPTISDLVLLVWKSRVGVDPILAGARAPVRNLGFLDAVISEWL